MVISPDGRCKTFSADANGFARAEGCAALVLKRLSDAVKDGDQIWGLIRGNDPWSILYIDGGMLCYIRERYIYSVLLMQFIYV